MNHKIQTLQKSHSFIYPNGKITGEIQGVYNILIPAHEKVYIRPPDRRISERIKKRKRIAQTQHNDQLIPTSFETGH